MRSFVIARRPDNAYDTNYLDVMLVGSSYCLGHVEAMMTARLSSLMRDLCGSQPRNSLLHLDYAIRRSSMLDQTHAHTYRTPFFSKQLHNSFFALPN